MQQAHLETHLDAVRANAQKSDKERIADLELTVQLFKERLQRAESRLHKIENKGHAE